MSLVAATAEYRTNHHIPRHVPGTFGIKPGANTKSKPRFVH